MAPIDPALALDALRARLGAAGPAAWPAGAPAAEYERSPAAQAVGALAAEAGLFAFHFEHRHALGLPADWVPEGQPALARAPAWSRGVLPESKYQSFRHDLAVASFHPGHRAKWGTHELCHALVGFAWRADATPLFHATASRLAELLPVALWYFLDEAFLRRCPDHVDGGALFRRACPACEAMAAPSPHDARAREALDGAARFLDRELAAIARTRREGRPVPHTFASLDLCSDGIAYAAAHGARLDSEAHRRWMDAFAVRGGGWCEDLDALEARVVAVARAIAHGEPLRPLAPSAAHGRWRWTLQDLGARLLQVWAHTEGEAAEEMLAVVERLTTAARATEAPTDPGPTAEDAITAAIAGWRALYEEWVVPSPEQVFAVGYALPGGLGSDLDQLADGVRSALPRAARLDGVQPHPERVAAFAALDLERPVRVGLGRRWAAWRDAIEPGVDVDVARLEAALTHPLPGDGGVAAALGPVGQGPWTLAEGVEVLVLRCDADAALDALRRRREAPPPAPTGIVVGPGRDGTVVWALDADAARDLATSGSVDDLPDPDADGLRAHGLARPARWFERPS